MAIKKTPQLNIYVEHNSPLDITYTFKDNAGTPLDFTDLTAAMEIRKTITSDAVETLTTENGKLELGGVLGTIRLLLTQDEVSAIPAGEYIQDLYTKNASLDNTFRFRGKFVVCEVITRI